MKDIAQENKDLIEGFKRESQERALAWKEFLGVVQSGKGVKPAMVEEAEPVAVTVEEAAKEALPKEPAQKVEEVEEGLKDRVLETVTENPSGLRMTQVADSLGLENWRVLIPVFRVLVDEGKMRKEGPLYFVSEV